MVFATLHAAGPEMDNPAHQIALELLAAARDPACVLDPVHRTVIGANETGVAAFGLDIGIEDWMEVAESAMKELCELADSPRSAPLGDPERRETDDRHARLVFLSADGPRTLECSVAIVHHGLSSKLAVVSLVAATAAIDPERAVPAGEPTSPATVGQATDPARPADDASTLAAIALRIREALAERAAAASDAAHVVAPGDEAVAAGVAAPPSAVSAATGISLDQSLQHPDGLPSAMHAGRSGMLPRDAVAKLAHELKTPLSAIVAAAEIMRDERLGPIGNSRYLGYAGDIYETARHALAVISSLLEARTGASQSDTGMSGDGGLEAVAHDTQGTRQSMAFTEVDLNATAESCVSSLKPLAEAAGLLLTGELAPRLPHLIADRTAVRQIALNLLTNAIRFTEPGGRIEVVTRHHSCGAVSLEIRDSGRGMGRAEIARVMAQTEDTAPSARFGGGLGIGLPLVRTLALANGAALHLESEPGRGTAAIVTFGEDRVVPV